MSPSRRNGDSAAPSARTALVAFAAALLALAVAAAPALAGLGDRTLRRGAKGRDVAALQRILTKLDRPTSADGAFGRRTDRNVRAYERRRRWKPNGLVGCGQAHAMSRASRGVEPGKPPFRYGDRTLRRGRTGPDVKGLQKVLGWLGHSIPQTGTFGPQTFEAVKAWERSVRWRDNGLADCRQLHRMRRQGRSQARVPASARGDGHVFPVRGPHTYGGSGARFGAPRGGRRHMGQDIPARTGTALAAPWNGVVSWKRYGSGAGHYLVIRADDGLDYVFMHLPRPAPVDEGDRVTAGQRIGEVGCTGSCTGPHLHFEAWTAHWYDGGRAFDPLPLLKEWDAAD